ncbi:MAG: hypothetical protein ACKOQM_14580 [Novosphingobium sp.]
MKALKAIALLGFALVASPMLAQDGDSSGGGSGEIIVTASRRNEKLPAVMTQLPYLDKRPVTGLRRPADGVVRHIEIVSDSREAEMRRSEVQAMLLAALDRARKEGLSLVTGQLEVTEVTRENWKVLFPGLAGPDDKVDDEDDDDNSSSDDEDDNESGKVTPTFEDDGDTATIHLMVKTKLTGTIADAQHRITTFVKAVPATGRSLINQQGPLALTIIGPEQYRDEIYRRIAEASKHAGSFYGPEYGVTVTGLDREIAWAQVSNTEVFLYIPYGFTVGK